MSAMVSRSTDMPRAAAPCGASNTHTRNLLGMLIASAPEGDAVGGKGAATG